MRAVAVPVLAVLLAGCTATFIGDRAYRSAPDFDLVPAEPPTPPPLRDFEIADSGPVEQLTFQEPVDATKQRFHELSPRRPVEGATRPRMFATAPPMRVTLPVLSPEGPSWPGGGLSWFSLRQADASASLTVFPELTAEVMIGESRFYTSGPVPGAELRGPVSWNKVRACESDQAATSVRWNGFLSSTRTDQKLDYFEMRGLLSPKGCRAEANEVRSVTAVAVLPGVIYAARRCADPLHCVGPTPQSIILIGPPAKWMPSTTDHTSDLLVPHTGSFSRAEIAIRKGGAGSALFTVQAEHIEKFRRARNPVSFIGVSTIAISVDVIWPSTADEPTFSVQFAAVDSFTPKRSQTVYDFSEDPVKPDSFPDPRSPSFDGRR